LATLEERLQHRGILNIRCGSADLLEHLSEGRTTHPFFSIREIEEDEAGWFVDICTEVRGPSVSHIFNSREGRDNQRQRGANLLLRLRLHFPPLHRHRH